MSIEAPRRSILAAAAAAAAVVPTAAGRAQSPQARVRYPFDRAGFPRYRLEVTVDRAAPLLRAVGEIEVPPGLVRDGALVVALTEDARDLVLTVGDDATPITPQKRDDPKVQPPLRRWTWPIPQTTGPIRVRFSFSLAGASSVLFAIRPDGAVASGVGTAWYPQLERADGVRLEGTGELTIRSGADVIVAGGVALGPNRFRIDEPRYFDFAAAPWRTVSSVRGRARLYLLRDHPRLETFVERLDRLIGVLETHFGPLPQERLDLAEAPPTAARDGGFDGASLDGFMLAVGFYFDQPFNTAFFGHEVAHQWWGGLVRRIGLNGAYVLDESLAQYASLLAVEDIEGEAAAGLYRRRGFPGYYAEYGGFTYLARTLAGIDAPIADLPLSDGFISRRVVNAKGMLVWSMLADLVGRDRFSAFLKGFVRAHAYRRASLAEFLAALRGLLGPDAGFIDDWLMRPGAPGLSLHWTQSAGAVRATIRQAGGVWRMRLPLEIRYADARRSRHEVMVAAAETVFEAPARGRVAEVILDPEHRVLRWTPELRREAQALLPYTRAEVAFHYGLNTGDTDEARKLFAAVPSAPADDRYGLRALIERGMGDLEAAAGRHALAVAHFRKALALAPPGQTWIPEIWRALADAYRKLGLAEEARRANAEGALAIEHLLASARRRHAQVVQRDA